jgi:hypothetical protein
MRWSGGGYVEHCYPKWLSVNQVRGRHPAGDRGALDRLGAATADRAGVRRAGARSAATGRPLERM